MDSKNKKTPDEKREHLRQSELKNNPMGALNDGVNRGSCGNLNGIGWKETLVLILVLFIGYIIYKLFFS